jgi:hypothetical protein
MYNLTPRFNELLEGRSASPAGSYKFSIDEVDEFLKEAYRIVGSVRRLITSFEANALATELVDCQTPRPPPFCSPCLFVHRSAAQNSITVTT